MKQQGGAKRVESLIREFGCLPAIPEYSRIPRFDRRALAAAIECELNRAADYGHSKITLHMDLPDAALLAKYLRA